jgi:single-strand DNA-binding protein
MNKVILLGRLTKDPDMRVTGSGVSVAQFSLAVNRRGKDSEIKADYFNVVAYDKTATFIENYARKGKQFVVVGRLQNRSWEDKEGRKVYVTEVIAEEMHFADSKSAESQPSPQKQAEDVDFTRLTLEDDVGLPF